MFSLIPPYALALYIALAFNLLLTAMSLIRHTRALQQTRDGQESLSSETRNARESLSRELASVQNSVVAITAETRAPFPVGEEIVFCAPVDDRRAGVGVIATLKNAGFTAYQEHGVVYFSVLPFHMI